MMLKREQNNMSKYDLPKKFDHKDTDILRQFITETGKIIPARVTGIKASNQRKNKMGINLQENQNNQRKNKM